MEVDESSDMDQSLLLQFECLGTRDRDELVREFISLTNDSVSKPAATFFLDMNSWNLQAAVCSFYDFGVPKEYPCMALCDQQNPTKAFTPNLSFRMEWEIMNTGSDYWPRGITLVCVDSNFDVGTSPVLVRPIRPQERIRVDVTLLTPSLPGNYSSTWRLMLLSGTFFGDLLEVKFQVCSDTAAVETDLSEDLQNRMVLCESEREDLPDSLQSRISGSICRSIAPGISSSGSSSSSSSNSTSPSSGGENHFVASFFNPDTHSAVFINNRCQTEISHTDQHTHQPDDDYPEL